MGSNACPMVEMLALAVLEGRKGETRVVGAYPFAKLK
jgi:hypothetical protein